MADQISIEDAFPVFRQRCGELADENLLLRGKIAGLEKQNGDLRSQVERLVAEQKDDGAQHPAEPGLPVADAVRAMQGGM